MEQIHAPRPRPGGVFQRNGLPLRAHVTFVVIQAASERERAERCCQKDSSRLLSLAQRRAMMALAPASDQCIPARLRRVLMATLQPAATTPEEVQSPRAWKMSYRIRWRFRWI